ncbi:MAG: hypothetical protein BroJett003_14110 [Planctomycetota bacterium]|nr:MAG: hypothetical protein BroJett003_14110 [Planctomycetota bacterium]
MSHETIPDFDCLEFKWKAQADLYDATKHMTREEQIAFFRRRAETGSFAELFRTSRMPRDGAASPGG